MEMKDLRTGLFGFNKNDVCEYISQLNHIYEEREKQKSKEYMETAQELSKKNEELNNHASRLNQENTELKRINDELKKRLTIADGRSKTIEPQMNELRKATFSVIEEIMEQLNSVEKKISDFQTEQGYV